MWRVANGLDNAVLDFNVQPLIQSPQSIFNVAIDTCSKMDSFGLCTCVYQFSTFYASVALCRQEIFDWCSLFYKDYFCNFMQAQS